MDEKEYWDRILKDAGFTSRQVSRFDADGRLEPLKDKERWCSSHLLMALHNLDAASVMRNSKPPKLGDYFQTFSDWVVTISYYAMYQACLSLLAYTGRKSESHKATITAVANYFYHSQKLLSPEDMKLIAGISQKLENADIRSVIEEKKKREEATYGIGLDWANAIADEALANAKGFVAKTRVLLQQAGIGIEDI